MKNMLPLNGYDINLKLSYELNDFLDGFGIYEDSGTFGSILSENNTFRLELGVNKHWTLIDSKKITIWEIHRKLYIFFQFLSTKNIFLDGVPI